MLTSLKGNVKDNNSYTIKRFYDIVIGVTVLNRLAHISVEFIAKHESITTLVNLTSIFLDQSQSTSLARHKKPHN